MENAVKFFRGAKRYNCAQAVLKGFQEKHAVSQGTIDAFKAHGGGRAEGGLCGALYAAKFLLKNKEQATELENHFSKVAGSIHCKEIRKLNRVLCAECVQTSAKLLNELS